MVTAEAVIVDLANVVLLGACAVILVDNVLLPFDRAVRMLRDFQNFKFAPLLGVIQFFVDAVDKNSGNFHLFVHFGLAPAFQHLEVDQVVVIENFGEDARPNRFGHSSVLWQQCSVAGTGHLPSIASIVHSAKFSFQLINLFRGVLFEELQTPHRLIVVGELLGLLQGSLNGEYLPLPTWLHPDPFYLKYAATSATWTAMPRHILHQALWPRSYIRGGLPLPSDLLIHLRFFPHRLPRDRHRHH